MYILHKIEAAQVFDELSILEVKRRKSDSEERGELLKKQINSLKEEIVRSLGNELTEKICSSELYNNLFLANLKIFESVDRFKHTEPAQLNMKRVEAKRELQKKFFAKDLEEIKM